MSGTVRPALDVEVVHREQLASFFSTTCQGVAPYSGGSVDLQELFAAGNHR